MHIDEGKCTGREEMEDAVVTSQLGSGSTPLFSALAISRQIRVPHPHKDGAGTYGYSSPSTHHREHTLPYTRNVFCIPNSSLVVL